MSFSVIAEDKIVSEKHTTYFRSVVAFGKTRIVEGDKRLEAFEAKRRKISECTQVYIIAIDVKYIAGKEAIEYINAKR